MVDEISTVIEAEVQATLNKMLDTIQRQLSPVIGAGSTATSQLAVPPVSHTSNITTSPPGAGALHRDTGQSSDAIKVAIRGNDLLPKPLAMPLRTEIFWFTTNTINHFFSESISRTGMMGNLLIVSSYYGAEFHNPVFLRMLKHGCTVTDDANLLDDPFWFVLFIAFCVSTLGSVYLVWGKKDHWYEYTTPTGPKKNTYTLVAAVQESLEAWGFVGMTIFKYIPEPMTALIVWLSMLPIMAWPIIAEYVLPKVCENFGIEFERGPLQNYWHLPWPLRVLAMTCELAFTIMTIAATADSLWTAINITMMDYGHHVDEEVEQQVNMLALGLSSVIGFIACLGNEAFWRDANVLLIGVLSDATYPILFYMSAMDCTSNQMENAFVMTAAALSLLSIIGYIPPRARMLKHDHASSESVVVRSVAGGVARLWRGGQSLFAAGHKGRLSARFVEGSLAKPLLK